MTTVSQDNKIEEEQYSELPRDQVIHGECLEVMRGLPDCSVDCCVTDPPYGFGEVKDIAGLLQAWMQDEDESRYLGKGGFMNAQWDSGVPGPRYWREVYRVLKPGAHILAFSSTRTYDLLVIALRLAGFQIRDTVSWVHGQGFPKSLNLGNGRGTALKPAVEPICLARKPLSEKTLAQNVLRWNGCGALNIDKCRVGLEGIEHHRTAGSGAIGTANGIYNSSKDPINRIQQEREQQGLNPRYDPTGRFPANILLSHDPRCIARGTKRVLSHNPGNIRPERADHPVYGKFEHHGNGTGYADEHGLESVQDWHCVEGCAVYQLSLQAGESKSSDRERHNKPHIPNAYGAFNNERVTRGHEDSGSKTRYFTQLHDPLAACAPFYYCSKASRRDRDAGLEDIPAQHSPKMAGGEFINPLTGSNNKTVMRHNSHPTVKSLQLMRFLCRLVGVPGGIILDPFCGSGSTLCAAIQEGFHFIGIEQSNTPDAPYVDIARARIAHAQQEARKSEAVQEWECVPECAIAQLDKQGGIRKSGRVENHAGSITPNSNGIYNPLIRSKHSVHEASEGMVSRFFTQLSPDPVSLWDEEVAQ